jgi:ferredoxin-NADP reductase
VERVGEMSDFSARLVDRHWLAPGILEWRLTRPAGVGFIPGQFLRFVMDGYQRDYTMVSDPDAETLDFCMWLWWMGGVFPVTFSRPTSRHHSG